MHFTTTTIKDRETESNCSVNNTKLLVMESQRLCNLSTWRLSTVHPWSLIQIIHNNVTFNSSNIIKRNIIFLTKQICFSKTYATIVGKKICQQWKMPVWTVGIKKFTETGNVSNRPGRGHVCKLTTRELQKSVESWGQKVSLTSVRWHLEKTQAVRDGR